MQCCRAGGAEIILIPTWSRSREYHYNKYQFGGCWHEEKLISTSLVWYYYYRTVLLLSGIFMAIAGAGAGAKIMDKGETGAENK